MTRKLKRRATMLFHWLRRSPIRFAGTLVAYTTPGEVKNGIWILDSNKLTRDNFINQMEVALKLIESHCPMHWERVRKQIRAVIHLPCSSGVDYDWPSRVCTIELKRICRTDDRNDQVFLSCMLVYAATHGHLARKGIVKTGRNWERIERVCVKNVIRVAKNLGDDSLGWLLEEDMRRPGFKEHFRGVFSDLLKLIREKP